MNRYVILAIVLIASLIPAYFIGKYNQREGYSFGKAFFFGFIGSFGLMFFLIRYFTS